MTIDYSREPQTKAASTNVLPNPPLPDDHTVEDLPGKISAYYCLVFPNFTFYVRKVTITIGRRTVGPGAASTSDAQQVDFDLGPLKSVSRLHARIEYDENMERFVLVVLGRNGAWVDGVWSGSGSRVPLGLRSQIRIATREFHFMLPSPSAPEDSPSPISPASTTRHLSPSIDVTSLSPDSSVHSPIATHAETPSLLDEPNEPVRNGKPQNKAVSKKRKKPGESRPPPPEVMPPRPVFTYAQLCYKAITALNGKATLQEICSWISDNFDWYRYHEGTGWESSVRHNLSSNRAFQKMERCAGERGKGFFWSVDPRFEHLVKEHEGKASDAKGKGKNPKLLEPPLKRSVKGDSNSPLPPPAPSAAGPFTTTPLPPTRAPLQTQTGSSASPTIKVELQEPSSLSSSSSLPLRVPSAAIPASNFQSASNIPACKPDSSSNSAILAIPSDINIPIVMGSTTTTDATQRNNESGLDFSSPPIALQRDTIVLNSVIFSGLTPEQLKELEALGAKKAIEILQSYIVRFLKEKRRVEGAKTKGKKKRDKAKKKRDEKHDASICATEVENLNVGSCSSGRPSKDADAPSKRPGSEHSLSPATEIARAVAPLRLSTPPPPSVLTAEGQSNEEIDIMGDSDEPFPKKRRVEVDEV